MRPSPPRGDLWPAILALVEALKDTDAMVRANSREQDDLALRAMYSAANRIRDAANLHVIIDGRTFSKAYQVRDLFTAAERMGLIPCIIECICSDLIRPATAPLRCTWK